MTYPGNVNHCDIPKLKESTQHLSAPLPPSILPSPVSAPCGVSSLISTPFCPLSSRQNHYYESKDSMLWAVSEGGAAQVWGGGFWNKPLLTWHLGMGQHADAYRALEEHWRWTASTS